MQMWLCRPALFLSLLHLVGGCWLHHAHAEHHGGCHDQTQLASGCSHVPEGCLHQVGCHHADPAPESSHQPRPCAFVRGGWRWLPSRDSGKIGPIAGDVRPPCPREFMPGVELAACGLAVLRPVPLHLWQQVWLL
jgi:hypothetical protein